MDNEVVRKILFTSWLDLSDAFILRRFSKGWKQTLDKDDVFVWESILDLTHGRDVADGLRRSFSPRRGYELARHIHLRNGKNYYNRDEPTVSLRTTEDLTCLIEFGRVGTESGKKFQLASIFGTWDELKSGIEHASSARTLPTIPMPKIGSPAYDDLERQEKEEICNIGRVTFFRRDTQQRVSEELEIEYVEDADEFKGNVWFRGGGWIRYPFKLTFNLDDVDLKERVGVNTMRKLKLLKCKIILQKATYNRGRYGAEDVERSRINQLLGNFNRLSWK